MGKVQNVLFQFFLFKLLIVIKVLTVIKLQFMNALILNHPQLCLYLMCLDSFISIT